MSLNPSPGRIACATRLAPALLWLRERAGAGRATCCCARERGGARRASSSPVHRQGLADRTCWRGEHVAESALLRAPGPTGATVIDLSAHYGAAGPHRHAHPPDGGADLTAVSRVWSLQPASRSRVRARVADAVRGHHHGADAGRSRLHRRGPADAIADGDVPVRACWRPADERLTGGHCDDNLLAGSSSTRRGRRGRPRRDPHRRAAQRQVWRRRDQVLGTGACLEGDAPGGQQYTGRGGASLIEEAHMHDARSPSTRTALAASWWRCAQGRQPWSTRA